MMKRVVCLLIAVTVSWASNEKLLQEFVKANNLFAVSVYKEIVNSNNGNFLVSPYSAEVILAFAQAGCKSNTSEQLRNSLHLPNDKHKIEAALKTSIPLLTGSDFYSLHVANKMYVESGFSINENFKKTAVEVYRADVESIDFGKKVEAANTINKWVENETNTKIKNLIDPGVLDSITSVVLVNALHFRGKWKDQFPVGSTKKQKFYKTAENVIELDMMHRSRKWYSYYESSELKAKFLELPFEDEDASMIIALPNEIDGLQNLENQIDKVFRSQTFKREYVNIALPKFKIESTISFVPLLKNLGVSSAFDVKRADLSGIAGQPGDLVFSDIIQKTHVYVKEEGVEAASVTYLSIHRTRSGSWRPPEQKNFIADHPFIFYIKTKNFILFAGRFLASSH